MKELNLQETQNVRGGCWCSCKPTAPGNGGTGGEGGGINPPTPSKKCS